jgi:hypothetical protein
MLLAAGLAPLTLAGCGGPAEAAPAVRVTYGAGVPVGAGEARVYVLTDGDRPVEVGVALTDPVLAALPADGAPGGIMMPDGHHTYDFILPMPAGNPTPYRFVGLGWNPAGHEPPGIFDRPHFDFHFYTISQAERAAILPSDPRYEAKSANEPAAEYVPAGYIRFPGAVPLMGAHWGDPQAPELNGEPFTETFLYGTWDGRLTFAEPMVTKEFIEATADFRRPIAVPARYDRAGWYPTEYRVYRDAASGEYRVALASLTEYRGGDE